MCWMGQASVEGTGLGEAASSGLDGRGERRLSVLYDIAIGRKRVWVEGFAGSAHRCRCGGCVGRCRTWSTCCG